MRRRVQGEEEDEELDEDEDRLDVVGLEDTSPRPGVVCTRRSDLAICQPLLCRPKLSISVSVCQ